MAPFVHAKVEIGETAATIAAEGRFVEAAVDGVVLRTFVCDDGFIPGDVDGDGTVGVLDLLQLLTSWGQCTCPADLNGDGVVGISDLLILLASWS